ncbi:uncharacterized protein LOC116290588 [Actinia tenebrosa]|uniref:Uncharacterized protein LOC116290588 n=1 Tax=Actinia tenebrosa TaxID=6105 RepID=A0A6P8HLH1_ACTTE|nr:uncharacterized protein LOC116290588 [Actinia tenebrosa]
MSFKIQCQCVYCERYFLSTRTLEKHCYLRHNQGLRNTPRFFDSSKKDVTVPVACEIADAVVRANYLRWLACLVERVNGAHHPKSRGRWFRVEVFQVPEEFFHRMLWKLNGPYTDAVRKMSHLKQPMIVNRSLRFSYKFFDEQPIIELFHEQSDVVLQLKAAYTNAGELVTNDPYDLDDPREALRAAKRRAGEMKSKKAQPNVRSSLTICQGEGRATREFELQWWPAIYKTAFGKLTLRFFVNKVHM